MLLNIRWLTVFVYMAQGNKGRFFPANPGKYKGNANNIVWRSNWELTFMNYCDNHSDVIEWSSEELQIPYYFQGDGKWHRYFPDFWMRVKSKVGVEEWIVEVKPKAQTQHPQTKKFKNPKTQLKETIEYTRNQAKWAAATKFCATRKWKFVILTEQDLYSRA